MMIALLFLTLMTILEEVKNELMGYNEDVYTYIIGVAFMKNKNLVKCIGKDISFHENTVINFNLGGFVLGVSLNIPPEIKDYLSPNNVRRG